MILLETITFALILSLLTGGSLRNLEHEHLYGERVLFLLLPLQIMWPRVVDLAGLGCAIGLGAWLIMMVVLVLVLVLNVSRRWALAFAAVGIAFNVLVIGFNGAMPVSLRSVSEIGSSRPDALAMLASDCLHEPLQGTSRLAYFADVIAIPGPAWQRGVVSPGDLLLALGLGSWVFVATRGDNRRP